jgi:hypothetical protein
MIPDHPDWSFRPEPTRYFFLLQISTVASTDHQQHLFALQSSLKQSGITVIVLAFLDRGLAAFAIVCTFEDKCVHSLHAIPSRVAHGAPETILWIEYPIQGIQDGIRT